MEPEVYFIKYAYPCSHILCKVRKDVSEEELISNKNKIVETLANYKIQIDKIKATIGPK